MPVRRAGVLREHTRPGTGAMCPGSGSPPAQMPPDGGCTDDPPF
ncbi:MAG: hypothetical protein M0030_11490 [Actinomycetota bacterium]|nr:hypothetical protein [Actinomycetota bacterium]